MKTFVLAALLIGSATLPGAAQDPSKGAALLGEARAALGGEDKLRAVKTLQARGDFKRTAGQTTIEGELEIRLDASGKLRRDEDLSLPGGGPAVIRTEALNGTEVWDENTGGGGQFAFRRGGRGGDAFGRDGGGGGRGDAAERGGRANVDPEQLRQLQLRNRQADFARFMLALLLTTNDAVTWVGTAESPDGKADVLEIKPAAGPATRLFLDVATHVPLMLTWQGPGGRGGRGGPATARMTLGEYKTVNGIRLPHFITRGINDQTIEEWTVSNYRVNPSFRADVFAR